MLADVVRGAKDSLKNRYEKKVPDDSQDYLVSEREHCGIDTVVREHYATFGNAVVSRFEDVEVCILPSTTRTIVIKVEKSDRLLKTGNIVYGTCP
jgi:hypothetical protein